MNHAAPHEQGRPTYGRLAAVGALVAVVIGIVGVAFRGSWGALRDAALSCHLDPSSATLYPFAVDGLLIVAILAAVLLRHDDKARRYCLGIIAAYTFASWLMNFLHGLGQFALDPATNTRPVPAWPVVVVVASLLIGSIFLGSHLVVFVWRHLWPEPISSHESQQVYRDETPPGEDIPPVTPPPADQYEAAKAAYRHSLDPALKTLSQTDLMNRFGISKRQAGQVQTEVKQEPPAHTLTDLEHRPEWATTGPPDWQPITSVNGHHPDGDHPEGP